MIFFLLCPIPFMEFLAHRFHRLHRENELHRKSEVFTDPERQIQTGIVFFPFQIPHRLKIDTDDFRELLSGDALFLAKHGDPVVDLAPLHRAGPGTSFSVHARKDPGNV